MPREASPAPAPTTAACPAVERVTPALQQVLRLLARNPYAVAVHLPRATAEQRVAKILMRYPSAARGRNTRSALRGLGLPAVSALLMPPDPDGVTLILFANVPPPGDREDWRLAADPDAPLTWRAYEVARVADVQREANRHRKPQPAKRNDARRLTWRLSRESRDRYREQVTRTIHDGNRTAPGQAAVLLRLSRHLGHYPGLHGIRQDCWMLSVHMRRQWRAHHGAGSNPPAWPRFPYCKRERVTYAPLRHLWPKPAAPPARPTETDEPTAPEEARP